MNNRIEQMMADASGGACYDGNQLALYDEDIKKFTELILEECLKYIDDSFGDIDYVKFMIKRNFGVGK
jgi:hypothetical protein